MPVINPLVMTSFKQHEYVLLISATMNHYEPLSITMATMEFLPWPQLHDVKLGWIKFVLRMGGQTCGVLPMTSDTVPWHTSWGSTSNQGQGQGQDMTNMLVSFLLPSRAYLLLIYL